MLDSDVRQLYTNKYIKRSITMTERSAFITGAATGIGEALSLKLDQMGWRVFATYNKTPPDELIKKASPRLTAMACNVGDPKEIVKAAEQVGKALNGGALDLLVNNAATTTGAEGPIESLNIDEFHFLMEVNFWASVRTCQAFLPLIKKSDRGRIMNVDSGSIYMTIPLGCPYPVSKCALSAFTRHLRVEMEPFGIEVTALEPGGVRTKMTSFTKEEEEKSWASIPERLLPEYKKYFNHPGAPIDGQFEFWPPEKFAEEVYKIIIAKKWKPSYLVGAGVWPMPLMHRLMSRSRIEKIWKKVFKVKF